jgi:hypothetical protein
MYPRPRRRDVRRLADVRSPWCVTIYGDADHWMRGNHAADAAKAQIRLAADSLESAGAPSETIAAIRARLEDLTDPARSSAHTIDRRAQSVGIFASEDAAELFALTSHPTEWVGVSDRFVVGPLLEAALSLVPPVFVLALSENVVRLVDVTAHPVELLDVTGIPRDLKGHVALDLTGDRNTLSHLRTSEEPKERLRQYARAIDHAVEPVLRRSGALLVIAAAEPIASIYRTTTSFEGVTSSTLAGNHDDDTLEELAELATPVIERHRREDVEEQLARFAEIPARGRVLAEIDEIDIAAREGRIDTLFIDMDRRLAVPAEAFGRHTTIDRTDEIVRHAIATDATIVPVRSGDLPTLDPVAAVLRYAPVDGAAARSN